MVAAIALLLAGGLAVGVFPQFAKAVGRAAAAFVDQRAYLAQALPGLGDPGTPQAPPTDWTTSGVLLGVLSAALAVGVAFAALYPPRVPDFLARPVRSALAGLHQLHSGHIGDYAAWLVLGAGAIAGLLIV
jgi:multicomponent Na+:H+ antiporter subunit D